jgi:hypothetical protein
MLNRLLIAVTCITFFHHVSGMQRATRLCRPIVKQICSNRPLNTHHVTRLLKLQKHEIDREEVRSHLFSLCHGFENYWQAESLDELYDCIPNRIKKEIEYGILHAHYKTKTRGYLCAALASATGAMAAFLALKTGQIELLHAAPLENHLISLGSFISLTHTTHHLLSKASHDLTYGPAEIEMNIVCNTALLKIHLKNWSTESEQQADL